MCYPGKTARVCDSQGLWHENVSENLLCITVFMYKYFAIKIMLLDTKNLTRAFLTRAFFFTV